MPHPRILLVTSELFPEFGYPTAGGGVRAQQLYRSLEAQGFPIELALARGSAEGRDLPEWATRFLFRQPYLDAVIEQADPDLVLSESWEGLSHRRVPDNRLYVADCPGPLVLERCFGSGQDLRADVHHKIRTLALLDAVLVSNPKMKAYLMGWLTLAGWRPEDSDRLVQVPIALPESLPGREPRAQGDGLNVFVGGVSWAWRQSSDWLVRLADLVAEKGKGTLHLRMGPHPLDRGEARESEELPPNLKNHPAVRLQGLTDFDGLLADLSRMDLAVEWSPEHFERELASPFRLVNYLWCGVPVVIRTHLEMAEDIRRWKAGWVVDDWEDVAGILDSIRENPALLAERAEGARALAREKHVWPRAHQGMFEMFDKLTLREKSPSFLTHSAQTFERLEAELHERRIAFESMTAEHDSMSRRVADAEADAESFRRLRQKFVYRLWKKILG